MPYEYRYDGGLGCLFIRLFDDLKPEEVGDLMARVHAGTDFDPTAARLYDDRHITAPLSSSDIREIARIVQEYDRYGPPRAIAHVSDNDLYFALARMIQSLRDSQGYTSISAFRSMTEAIEWLGLSACAPDPFAPGVWCPDGKGSSS